ncbi:MAG: hypothetical protein AB7J63_09865 [Vicinamibacterales bacterium]
MDLIEQLCDHIDLLRKQHRAAINPSFGQVDELFELGDQVRASVRARAVVSEPLTPLTPCSVPACPYEAPMLVQEKSYCLRHGQEARTLLAAMQVLMPEVYAQVSRVDWPAAPPVPPRARY